MSYVSLQTHKLKNSNQRYSSFLTFCLHLLGPDARLYLSDVGLLQEQHAQARLAYAATDAEGQRVVQYALVEVER